MASDLNQCQFIGRLGKDPEVRYMASGDACASFSIAVGESWKDKASGEKQERTEWVRCVAWRQLAEIISEYCKKGQQVYVSGKMTTRKWQDKDGADRYSTEIIVDRMQMLRPPKESADGGDAPRSRSAPARPAAEKPYDGKGGFDDFESDIPFANPYRGRFCYVV